MIEEPYRWVEAISNRREYIENELATGSPTVGLSFSDGILLLTFGRDRRKIFEIYDRIAMGAIGHPGDIERLRMTAIELAGTEGFTRSAADVSLRRMATYSFSPALKQAFEQIYGAPYLVRILFAEVGETQASDLFVRLDYDGAMHANSMGAGKRRRKFRGHRGDSPGAGAGGTCLESGQNFESAKRLGSGCAGLGSRALCGGRRSCGRSRRVGAEGFHEIEAGTIHVWKQLFWREEAPYRMWRSPKCRSLIWKRC